MKPLILVLFLCFAPVINGQQKVDLELEEIKRLRVDFIASTKEYKSSLAKLLLIYEQQVQAAERKLEYSEKLLADGLISRTQVELNKEELEQRRARVVETKRQTERADTQIASLPSDELLLKELQRERRERQKAKGRKRCANWDLVARQRETKNSITFSYSIVCR